MRRTMTRSSLTASCMAAALALAAVAAPGAAAKESIEGDVTVTNTETVSVLMDAAGRINAQRVYEQLVLSGKGKVDISNPVSGEGLRNLDGFGGWEVTDGAQRVRTDVNGEQKYRSVADFTENLPVSIDVNYWLDGAKVQPGDVVGKSGDLEVRYTVINTTGVQQEVTFEDGEGNEKSVLQSVVIPLVGSMTTTLPSNFRDVVAEGANAAGDGKGGTTLSFTMTLFPPIGADRATFGYTAKIKDGLIPKASISLLPVNPLESSSFKGGAESYKAGADSGVDLTAGMVTIDGNLLKIRDGANDLIAGLIQLRDGSAELSAGLNNKAAPGAGKLAAGAKDLDAGAGKLAAGLQQAGGKAPALLGGLAQIEAGLGQVDAGLATLNGAVVPGADGISAGAAQLIGAIDTQLAPGLDGVSGALSQALAIAGTLPDPEKSQLEALIGGANGGVATVKAGLTGSVKGGLQNIQAGGGQISAGVDGATGAGGSLRNGVAALLAGVDQLQAGGNELVGGLGQLGAGANQLKDGTGKLSAGAGELAGGLKDAASGSSRLADGLATAADKAPALPEGAQELSDKGTSQVVNIGNSTAETYGLKYALIEAGAERAGEALPYGSPEGAEALSAYKFELAAATGEGSSNTKRGVAAAVLVALALGLAAMRRRVG